MPLTIEWNGGISIEHHGTGIVFDPQRNHNHSSKVFITHAHRDHSKGFAFRNCQRFSSDETKQIAEAYWKKIDFWQPLQPGSRTKVDDLEVVSHNAGHILGSTMFEAITPEGNIVYTGDLQSKDSLTLRGAEPILCDILIIESTFGSASFKFPEREVVAHEMIEWAKKTIRKKKIPAFKTDSLGNAQEITKAFNMYSELPVTVHPRVALINKLYNVKGQSLEFIDSDPKDALDVISSGECIFIAPKNTDLTHCSRFEQALVSGWALWTRRDRSAFPLSDHADFGQLTEFVIACKPKTVLTCFGGRFNYELAEHIQKQLGIEARPLDLIPSKFIFEA